MPHRKEMEVLREEDQRADLDWVRGEGADRVVDEETPLLSGGRARRERGTVDLTFRHLMTEKSFFFLGASMFLLIGPVESFSLGTVL